MLDLAATLDLNCAGHEPLDRLRCLRKHVDGRIVFTTSFGLEDQVIADMIFTADLDIDVVTLDTGRLFTETYQLWSDTEKRYGRRIRAYFPRTAALEALLETQGVDGQYASVAARKACCDIRKVEPLTRALEGAAAWVTGLRAEQSAHRSRTPFVAFDPAFATIKANPLADWSRDMVEVVAKARNVPVNPLHARGYPSIGCAPCTRAVRPGEPERAGRWWWEQDEKKECGLHLGPQATQRVSEGDRPWAV